MTVDDLDRIGCILSKRRSDLEREEVTFLQIRISGESRIACNVLQRTLDIVAYKVNVALERANLFTEESFLSVLR